MTWVPTYSGPAGGTKCGGLGDSIMTMTAENLAAKMPDNRWTFACFPGVTTSDLNGFGWPADLAASDPEHVVVIAGTNDCCLPDTSWNLSVLAAQQALLDAFDPATQIHWCKVYANPPSEPPGCSLQPHVQGWNQSLVNWQASYPNLHVVEWPTCVYYFTVLGVTMLQPDGYHPTEDGQNLLAHITSVSIDEAS